jgi:hypothetical protein
LLRDAILPYFHDLRWIRRSRYMLSKASTDLNTDT